MVRCNCFSRELLGTKKRIRKHSLLTSGKGNWIKHITYLSLIGLGPRIWLLSAPPFGDKRCACLHNWIDWLCTLCLCKAILTESCKKILLKPHPAPPDKWATCQQGKSLKTIKPWIRGGLFKLFPCFKMKKSRKCPILLTCLTWEGQDCLEHSLNRIFIILAPGWMHQWIRGT